MGMNFKQSISDDNLLDLYLSGVSVINIAKQFKVSREAVYARLRGMTEWRRTKRQVSTNRSLEKVTELQDNSNTIVEGWLAGVSMTDLAKEFNTTCRNISSIINKTVGTTKRRYNRDLEIVRRYNNGVTQADLAKIFHVSQPCISRVIHALNEAN